MKELLTMKGISKSFPGVKALNGLNFDLRAGEVHALIGENGAGKSTLMKILYGVYKPDSGEICVEGKKVEIHNASEAMSMGISIVFQEQELCPHLDVANNIFLGRLIQRRGVIQGKELYHKTKELLEANNINLNPKSLIKDLSVAERQMVEIMRAISRNAKILIFDEPTASLTEGETKHLFEIIQMLKNRGTGIIYISHRMEELDEIADRVTVVRDGEHIITEDYKNVTIDQLITHMVGRALTAKFPEYNRKIGEIVFEAKNVRMGKKVNLDYLNVRKGEILGLAGLVGAGRSETMRAICGIDKAVSAEVKLEGKELRIRKPREAIEAGLIYMTEDRKEEGLALTLDIETNLNIASMEKVSKHGVINHKESIRSAKAMVDRLSIKTPGLWQLAKNLSGGNQQKVILGKWLNKGAKVLIFDEPTRGIDVGAKFEIYNFMNMLSDNGVAIIMISSELPEILGMSDRVLVFHNGGVSAELEKDRMDSETIMSYATGSRK